MIAKGLVPQRAELIRGVIIEKMSKPILHTKLASRIAKLLAQALQSAYWVRREDPLSLRDSEPEPDISVVAGQEADYMAHPSTAALVVEVAVSTLAEDRELADMYAEAEVSEYWIVNVPERCLEIYRRPVNGQYASVVRIPANSRTNCEALPDVSVDVSELFQGLPEAV